MGPPRSAGEGGDGRPSREEHEVRQPSKWWLGAILAVVLLNYIVPFTLLSDVDAWYGSFLFWTVATAVVIAINAVVSAAWRD